MMILFLPKTSKPQQTHIIYRAYRPSAAF